MSGDKMDGVVSDAEQKKEEEKPSAPEVDRRKSRLIQKHGSKHLTTASHHQQL